MGMYSNSAAEKLGHTHIERRERRPVTLHGFVGRGDGSRIEAVVLDLSYEGCGVETAVALDEGETVKLNVVGLGAIETRVRWASGAKAGLVFEPDAPPDQPQYWPRRVERTSLAAEALLRRLGKGNYQVRVFDLSPCGCKVELVDKPKLDEHLLIRFDGLEALDAEVCWIAGNIAGLRFEKTIHPAVFDMLVERLH